MTEKSKYIAVIGDKVECATCHEMVRVVNLARRYLETHGAANDPCPGSQRPVTVNEDLFTKEEISE